MLVKLQNIIKLLSSCHLNTDVGCLDLCTFLQLMHFLSVTASCYSVMFITLFCLSIFQFPLVIICLSSVTASQFSSGIFLTCPYCFSWFRFLSFSCLSSSFISLIPVTVWSLLMESVSMPSLYNWLVKRLSVKYSSNWEKLKKYYSMRGAYDNNDIVQKFS